MTSVQSEFLKFAAIGVLNTLIHFGIFSILFRIFSVPLLIASAIGYAVGLVNSYFLNRRFTFRVTAAAGGQEFVRFCVVNLAALGLNLLVLHMLASEAGVFPELAQVIAIGFSLCMNFAGNRLWTFQKTRDQG